MTSIRFKIKQWLQGFDWYYKIRYGQFYQTYFIHRNQKLKEILAKEAKMYEEAISFLTEPPKLIFDIGANEGYTVAVFSKHSKKVIALEPSIHNLKILNLSLIHI